MNGQYEQQCNAAALKLLGVPVLKDVKSGQYKQLKSWIESSPKVLLDFPDETEFLLNQIIEEQSKQKPVRSVPEHTIKSPARFRNFVVKKIFYQLGAL